jgi:hypothetical protein
MKLYYELNKIWANFKALERVVNDRFQELCVELYPKKPHEDFGVGDNCVVVVDMRGSMVIIENSPKWNNEELMRFRELANVLGVPSVGFQSRDGNWLGGV